MFISKPHCRGAPPACMGAAMALPLLDAMVPALSAWRRQPPTRCAASALSTPHGIRTYRRGRPWTRAGSPICLHRCFRSRRSSITSPCSRISSSGTRTRPAITHRRTALPRCAKAKMNTRAATTSWDTVDQDCRQGHRQGDAAASLELGTDLIAQVGNCDNGLRALPEHLSWSSQRRRFPRKLTRLVFERLFGDGGNGSSSAPSCAIAAASRLDDGCMARCEGSSGPGDRTRLNQYSIRCARWSAGSKSGATE